MKYIRMVFVFASIIFFVFGSIVLFNGRTAIESSIAVDQLSDDIVVNTTSRSMIKNDIINGVAYFSYVIGVGLIVFVVYDIKTEKEN